MVPPRRGGADFCGAEVPLWDFPWDSPIGSYNLKGGERGLRWKQAEVTSMKMASLSHAWHLEEDQSQEGPKSTEVKHQKKHLRMWQIHTSPHLWRHLWAENPEETFTTSFIYMPTYGPTNSLCKHIKVQPAVCWSQLILLATTNCTHSVSLPCSVTLCWYLEFSHGRNLHHGNQDFCSGELTSQHTTAQGFLSDYVNGKCKRELHSG